MDEVVAVPVALWIVDSLWCKKRFLECSPCLLLPAIGLRHVIAGLYYFFFPHQGVTWASSSHKKYPNRSNKTSKHCLRCCWTNSNLASTSLLLSVILWSGQPNFKWEKNTFLGIGSSLLIEGQRKHLADFLPQPISQEESSPSPWCFKTPQTQCFIFLLPVCFSIHPPDFLLLCFFSSVHFPSSGCLSYLLIYLFNPVYKSRKMRVSAEAHHN